jgi:tetratricopeptide (TPR) repeat protein
MSKGHVSLKELKQDAVHDAVEKATDFWDLYGSKITTAVLVVLVVLLVGSWWNRYAQAQDAAASKQYAELCRKYQQACIATTVEDRDKAADAAINLAKDLMASQGSSKAGVEALYMRGNVQSLKGGYPGAIDDFKAYVQKTSDHLDKAKAYVAIGVAYENQLFDAPTNKELLEKAKEAFALAQKEGTVGETPTAYARQAMMGLGRLNEQSGDYAAAKAIYEAIVKLPSLDDEQKEIEKQLTADKPEVKASSAKDDAKEQAKQVRENIRESTRQFAFKKVAEERLKQLKARGV